ncbi:PH domain-containing protein [Kribbella solani]|uniref:Putative membrane protein YdbT with pleckstrin-like domain n=1 Tax=Kribbella solani TaxID=236067 RepID=A0A841DJJ6_9ACTN|nr:PH domain-containing protein [Kribbella solani]MBB5976860.1 putative membrane protein YdbT with pleckstrin-like domain [Kribbella solani]MDX2974574.1 PH domain-containing protein [Kribbella solani]MDX3005882.1 PH domain-containing protein [Kribbella solani]
MAGIGLFRIFDPKVRRHLISDEGEVVIDEVRHHWIVFAVPMLEILLATVLLVVMVLTKLGANVDLVLLVLVFVLLAHAFWKFLTEHRDRFVVTNMRVMRIRGVFSQTVATTPIARILDITLARPWLGRILGYGHFIFESAAQDQGFREIKFVSRASDRDLTIQRVIQRTGLRASASVDVVQGDEDTDDDGTGPIGMDSTQEVTISTPAPSSAPGAHQSRPAASKSIFNSDRGNWTDD